MAILGTSLDYTDRDFDSLLARLRNLISGVFPNWTEEQVANFGNLLVEMFSFVGDVLTKYQDNQALESRWTKATQRKTLIALAKLVGYEPPTATASQADVTISLVNGAAAGDVTITAGTVVRTKSVGEPVVFRLLTDAVIEAGLLEVEVTAENAEPQSDAFASTGTPNLELVLSRTPYLDGSAVIVAGNGVFSEVDNFLDSTSTERHFTLTVDQDDRARVRFGDGVAGQIPTGTITALYKTGGGAAGVVEAETIEVIEGAFTDEFGNSVQLAVVNDEASTPAVDRQSIEQIRQRAPESLRVLNRTVAREDYEINARRIPQVARALMLTSDEEVAIGENEGFLFVVPVGGGLPTQDLKDQVLVMVTDTFPRTITFRLTVSDPIYLAINIEAVVWLPKGWTSATATATKNRILTNLTAFFAVQNSDGTDNESIGFGFDYVETEGANVGLFPWSDVFNVIRDTQGVRKVDDGLSGLLLNGERSDVTMLLREFPTLGTVSIINGDTGAPI